jgi:hypothetical protein
MNIVRRATAHTFLALLEALLIASMVGVLIAGTALAGKGGGHTGGGGGGGKHGGSTGGTSSMALVMVTDRNGNGSPNFDDTITFDVSTTATAYPYVDVTCYQGGALVYSASAGFYPSYPWQGAQLMPLYSPSWSGGSADCKAVLNTNLYTLSFKVGA